MLEELQREMFGLDFTLLETERLLIRPIAKKDAADIFEIRGDQDTADWAGVRCLKSVDEVKSVIDPERTLSIVLGGEVIGMIETYSGGDELLYDSLFMGYYMKKPHRGKGYMTEALTALWGKWTDEGKDIPMLWIFPGNIPSEKVAAKSGWTYQGSHVVDINCHNQLVNFYY